MNKLKITAIIIGLIASMLGGIGIGIWSSPVVIKPVAVEHPCTQPPVSL